MKSQTGQSENYLPWADLAKAGAIVLVVLYHARHTTWLIGFENDHLADTAWRLIAEVLTPLRMPTFFVVSGMLAARSLTEPWEEVSIKRVWSLVYLYLLWAAIYMVVIPKWPLLDRPDEPLWATIGWALIGDTSAWYLYALVLFFVIGRLTRNVSTPLVLGAAFILSMGAHELPAELHSPQRLILQSTFFFLAGSRLKRIPTTIAETATLLRLALMTPVLAALLLLRHWGLPGIFPFVGSAAVVWCITAASLGARHSALLRRWGGWLGTRTLPIYVMHFIVLTGLLNAAAMFLPDSAKTSPALALAAPIILTAVTVSICLLAALLMPKLRLTWLLTVPIRRARA